MEKLLTPLETRTIFAADNTEHHLVPISSSLDKSSKQNHCLDSPEGALEVLKSKPDFDILCRVLRWLDPNSVADGHFSLKIPGPKTAQITHVLVADIVPDYWNILNDRNQSKEKRLLQRCLRTVTGVRVITARLRLSLDVCLGSKDEKSIKENHKSQVIKDLLNLLESLLGKDSDIHQIWKDIYALIPTSSQRTLLWKEFISLLTGGKLLSLVAEANGILNKLSSDVQTGCWLGDGIQYSTWLGRSIFYMLINSKVDDLEIYRAFSLLTGKALMLGYTGTLYVKSYNHILMCLVI